MQAKITAQKNENSARVVVRFNPEEVNWKKNDIIRVISKKKENKIILTRVAKKYSKQVAYTLTSTGRGNFSLNQGIFIKYRKNRFAGELLHGQTAEIFVDKGHNRIEIEMPKTIFNNQ